MSKVESAVSPDTHAIDVIDMAAEALRYDWAGDDTAEVAGVRWFTKKTIRKLCQDCGLEVLSVRHSAGNDLPEYRRAVPWRFLPDRPRLSLVQRLTRLATGLFACQHLISGRLPAR